MSFLARLALLAALLPACRALTLHPIRADKMLSERAVTGKTGLAWANGPNIDIGQYLATSKVSWYYSWSPMPTSDSSIEYVPMLWGTNQIGEWQGTINQTIAQHGVKNVLGFNEPQNPAQSNLTAQEGADLWKQFIQPLKAQGIRLGTPAPDSAPNGKTWLQDWLTACAGGCTPDFVALHWYGVNASEFIAYVADFHGTFNMNVWVTEWACQNFNDMKAQCSYDDVVSFMNQTQSFLDNTDYVERYAWFGALENLQGVNTDNALMTPQGRITALGEQYIGGNNSTAPVTSGVDCVYANWARRMAVGVGIAATVGLTI